MAGRVECGGCGAVLPERVGSCPACGAKLGRVRFAAWIGLKLAGVVLLALGLMGLFKRPGSPAPPTNPDVVASTPIFQLSADQKRTDVSGLINNNGKVPLDVTVRVRGYDYGDNLVADVPVKPIRVSPGGTRDVDVVLDLTPVKSVSIDVIKVDPVRP